MHTHAALVGLKDLSNEDKPQAVGDVVIIISYGLMDIEEARTFRPSVIFPDEKTNRLVR